MKHRYIAVFALAIAAVAQVPGPVTFVARTEVLGDAYVQVFSANATAAIGRSVGDIRIAGLPQWQIDQLRSRLSVHTGDAWSLDSLAQVRSAISSVDSNANLEVDMVDNIAAKQWVLWIGPPADVPPLASSVAMPPTPASVVPMGPGVSAPALLRKVDPEYSPVARAGKISGNVVIAAVIGPDGIPSNVQVIAPLEPGLDQNAVDAVQKWRFRPGSKDGAPVSTHVQIRVIFRTL